MKENFLNEQMKDSTPKVVWDELGPEFAEAEARILKKNGQIISGTYTYANNVKGNGGSVPFVIYSFADYDNFEVVTAAW